MIDNQYIFTRVLTTKFYHYSIMLQIVLTLALALMVFKQFQNTYMLEILLTCFMAFDILLRYLSTGSPEFWETAWNKIDIIIVSALFLIFIVQTLWHGTIEEIEIMVFAVRISIQVYRLIRLIKQQKDSRIVQNLEPVDLSFDNENLVQKFH